AVLKAEPESAWLSSSVQQRVNKNLRVISGETVHHYFSTHHMKPAFGVKLDRARINSVFLLENSFRQLLLGIVGEDRNDRLNDDRAFVAFFIDEVDGTPREAYAVLQRLFLHVQSGKGRQQCRMNVHDPVRESRYQDR